MVVAAHAALGLLLLIGLLQVRAGAMLGAVSGPGEGSGAVRRGAALRRREERLAAAAAAEQAQRAALPVLLLGWREFPLKLERGELEVQGRTVLVGGVANSGLGTGLTAWDGSIVLAKLLEQSGAVRSGATVLELGAGTGLVSIACAALGARRVWLTDLEYALGNAALNVARNAAYAGHVCTCLELDWAAPARGLAALASEQIDLAVAADVIWLPELVAPFVSALRAVCAAHPELREVLLAHQTRALRTDELLFEELNRAGFAREALPAEAMHPRFASRLVRVFRLRPPPAKNELASAPLVTPRR
jgi:predicted nicotinamide N-methyase